MENKMQLNENKIEQKALEGQFLRNCYVKAIESTNRISTVDPKDRKKVKEMEKNFEKEQKTGKHSQEKKEANQRAFIAEIIIRDLLNDCQIFGKDVSSKQTSRYDDIFNGIDLIMYLKEELEDINKNKVLKTATAGACIDVTTYSSYLKKQTIQDKFKKIYKEIKNGKMGQIKYFKNLEGDYAGHKKDIPKILVYINKDKLEEIANLWYRGEIEKLKHDDCKKEILKSIETQIKKMCNYANSIKQNKIANKYKELLRIFKVIEAKNNLNN